MKKEYFITVNSNDTWYELSSTNTQKLYVMEIKKNVNIDLNKNSLIYFQIGLILMLFASYQALEWKFYERKTIVKEELVFDDAYNFEGDIPITMVENVPPPMPASNTPPPPVVEDVFDIVENTAAIENDIIGSTETDQEERIATNEKFVAVSDIEDVQEEEVVENVPFMVIQNVPLFPGCEKEVGNKARKLCTSEKIRKLVYKKFNDKLGAELGLSGVHKIYVSFKIDTKGCVSDVRARGPHPRLEEEAKRVVKLIPKMVPGMQRKKPVVVLYSIPIIFEVRNI